VDCYVLESTPRPDWLPNYYRSKLIYWIDKKFFCPLRMEQYDLNGNLILVAERMSRNEYPEDGRLGYTPLIMLYWTTDIDLMTVAFHDSQEGELACRSLGNLFQHGVSAARLVSQSVQNPRRCPKS
jgi:hypothetical protein